MMPGMIMLWAGSVESIPSGWHLCDGTMGTPDLVSRFIMGAGVSMPPGYPGGTGTHVHAFTGDGHSHEVLEGNQIQSGSGWDHHVDTVPATGITNTASNLPPYYTLCYIMKL